MDSASEIAEYLADQGIGTVGTDIFVDESPSPNDYIAVDVVTVYNEGGRSPMVGTDIDQPNIAIIVYGDPERGDETWDRAEQIKEILHDVGNLELFNTSEGDGHRYILIRQRGAISRLPKDEHNRHLLRLSFSIMRTAIV